VFGLLAPLLLRRDSYFSVWDAGVDAPNNAKKVEK